MRKERRREREPKRLFVFLPFLLASRKKAVFLCFCVSGLAGSIPFPRLQVWQKKKEGEEKRRREKKGKKIESIGVSHCLSAVFLLVNTLGSKCIVHVENLTKSRLQSTRNRGGRAKRRKSRREGKTKNKGERTQKRKEKKREKTQQGWERCTDRWLAPVR
jgi:hypothetical protein